jgi:predicted AAA+ superfamily ATPase
MSTLRLRAAQYPVITLTGPRQSGKTTLCRTAFPEKPYSNLERMVVMNNKNGATPRL